MDNPQVVNYFAKGGSMTVWRKLPDFYRQTRHFSDLCDPTVATILLMQVFPDKILELDNSLVCDGRNKYVGNFRWYLFLHLCLKFVVKHI